MDTVKRGVPLSDDRCPNCGQRIKGLKERCVNGHTFDAANTYWRPDGLGRVCKQCADDRKRAAIKRRMGL
jgi:hypothetical protein